MPVVYFALIKWWLMYPLVVLVEIKSLRVVALFFKNTEARFLDVSHYQSSMMVPRTKKHIMR